MNNNCAITYDPGRLARSFSSMKEDYSGLSKLFLGNQNEGHFYELIDTANKLEQEYVQLSLRKGGEIPPFSKGKFISSVNTLFEKYKRESISLPFFKRELSDIYENSNGALGHLENTLYQRLMRLSFADPDKDTVTIDNSALNSNIQEYKNELFSSIYNFVKSKKPNFEFEFSNLYENKRFNYKAPYKQVMSAFVNIITLMDYKPDMTYADFERRKMLDIFNAAIILTNFDKLVESKFKNIVAVNNNNFGLLNNPLNSFHYTIKFKGLSNNFWNKDSHSEEGVEKHASNFVKVISSTIPLLDVNGKPRNDQYLGINGIYLLGVLIKNMNRNSDLIENFQINPKKSLKVFLEKLMSEKKLIYADKLKSLYNYLYSNRNGVVSLIERKIAENPDIAPNIIDIEAIIAHQLNNTVAPSYGMYNELDSDTSKKILNLVERDFLSDVVKNNIIDHILQNKNLYDNVKVDSLGNVSYGDLNINDFPLNDANRTKIKDLTGINITNNFRTIFSQTLSFSSEAKATSKVNVLGKSFAKLVEAGQAIVKAANGSRIVNYEQLSKLLDTTEIVDILNSYIGDLSPDANMTFKDSEGNNIPTVKQSNIAHEKRTVIDLARKHFGEEANNMLFISNPDLYKGTETVLEVVTDNGKVAPVYLNPEENLFLSFVRNYLNPMMESEETTVSTGKFLSFQLVNYSDKSTILNELIDQNYTIGKYGSLKNMSLENLKKLNIEHLRNFYDNLTNKIFNHYYNLGYYTESGEFSKVLPNLLNVPTIDGKINQINALLKTINKKTLDKYIYDTWNFVEEQKKLGNISKDYNFEFTDEVAYSKYNDGIRFNRTIGYYATNGNKLPALAETLFAKKLIELRPTLSTNSFLGGSYKNNITVGQVSRIMINLGLLSEDSTSDEREREVKKWFTLQENNTVSSIIMFAYTKDGVTYPVTNHNIKSIEIPADITEIKVNPLLAKWLHTQNLVRYNSLALSTKHEYQHPHKVSLDFEDDSEASIIKEITGRSISMTKRMVIHPATMEYYQQGLSYGIPPTIKLAVVNDLPCISYNFTGDLKGHDAWDGSLMANPFLTYLLKKSFPAKGIVDVQKAIGTSSADTHSVFLKCALFGITNEMIRKSAGSVVDLNNIMKAMNNIDIDPSIDLTRNSLTNNLIDLNQITPDGIFIKVGSKMLKLESMSRNESGTYNILYSNAKTGEPVIDEDRTIKNLYDLWQVFGGSYCMTEVHGGYEYSDDSIAAVGTLMSIVGNGALKENMVGILAQKSAVKNGATNINNVDILTSPNPKFMHSNFDTNFFGIQLDANHMSDDSVVNEVSQVISALAENQATPELYSELYNAIGDIINSELEEYNKNYKKEDGQFDIQKISKDFIEVLKRDTKQLGNANEIINLLENIAEKGLVNLPISNNNFYKGFVISVMSKMNSNFIKRKYPGLAAVLNPSYGMIQVYEDENGNTFFHDDLLDLAEEGDHVTDIKVPVNLRNSLTIQNVINKKFPNKPISAEKVKPLDFIAVINNETRETAIYNLKDINQYYVVKKSLVNNPNVTIERIHNKPRDLKPVEISFNQNGVLTNIFDNDPIRLTWSFQQFLKDGVITDDVKIVQNLMQQLNLTLEQAVQRLRQWNNRSFELLAINKNFKKVDLNTNFVELFGIDDFASKLDLSNYPIGSIEDITDYVHKDAEIIMPKRYRTEFSLGNNSFAKIHAQGETYFKKTLQGLVEPNTKDCDLYVANSNGEKIYISFLSDDEYNRQVEQGLLEPEIVNSRNIDGYNWRIDTNGEKMYKLPYNCIPCLDQDGNEKMIFLGKKAIKNIDSFLKSYKGQFIYAFANTDTNNKDKYIELAKKYNYLNFDKNILDNEYLNSNFDTVKEFMLNTLSNHMFTAWQKSHDIVAARIPSQAMQSFMSMKTIGYNEDPGNNVYVSHWQIWLQGSDFDIDKAYIMMHGMNKGTYEGWSPYFKHDSYDNLKLSEKLPVPNKIVYNQAEEGADLSGDLLVYKSLDKNNLDLNFIINLLEKVKPYTSIKANEDSDIKALIDIINNHNSYEYSIASLKNYVVRNIIETSRHPKNQISSYSPITFGKYEDVKKSRENNYTLSLMDGVSMFQQQETNAVGKDVIGIAANGIKDYFALIEYFSKYYSGEINSTDKEYFERSFSLGTGQLVKVNRIAGLNIEKKAIQLLNTYSNNQLSDIINPNSDPSLVLSALLSAATDNAKELILKAINAGKEFAAMHLYLIILGFDEGKVAEFMTSPKILKIMDEFKSNLFTSNKPKKTSDKVIEGIVSNDPDLIEFKHIFSLSKELTFLAKVLKINQGLSASSENLYLYFKGIENEFKSREREFIAINKQAVESKLGIKIDNVEDYLGEFTKMDKPYLDNDSYIDQTLQTAKDLGITVGGFSLNRYFKDSNYKKAAIEYYNLIKGTFNILDVVDKLGHFNGMVTATKNIEDQLKILSRKYKFVEEVVDLLKLSSPTERMINKIFDTYDDIVIHKWFVDEVSKSDKFSFNLKDIANVTGTNVNYYTKDGSLNELTKDQDMMLDFGDDSSLFNFKLVMENNIIPYLKRTYPNNDFISGLVTRKKDGRSWVSTKVRMNKLNDPKSQDILISYQKGIDILKDAGILFGDSKVKINDLLYLYNVIVNKDKSGSDRITKLLGNYVKDSNAISRDFYEYQVNLDLSANSDKDLLFTDEDPISNYFDAIRFGVLNERGVLSLGYGENKVRIKQNNPNFVLITSFNKEASYNEYRSLFKKLQKYIKNNNLLIELNCE